MILSMVAYRSHSPETREAFLLAQLQEGLRYDLMKAPSVSGVLSYPQLCVAAKSDERRLATLRKRQQLRTPPSRNKLPSSSKLPSRPTVGNQRPSTGNQQTPPRVSSQFTGCYNCCQEGHRAKGCRVKKSESRGTKQSRKSTTEDHE